MLKTRIIPTLLWKNFGLVKGIAFDSWRRVGPVLPAIKVYNSREVDELILVDIESTLKSLEPDYQSIKDFAEKCFVPLTVGGGITNESQIQRLLSAGADKVTINSSSYINPKLLDITAKKYGSQCIVASIDVQLVDKKYICMSHSGTKAQEKNLQDWVREVADRGAGEILITSIQNDGTMKGYDYNLLDEVVSSTDIPIIASGGAGTYEHMKIAITNHGVSAVAAASMFHFTEQTPLEAKNYLSKHNISVRKNFF